MQLYQTRSNAIILHNTAPAVCIEKVVIKRLGEALYNKAYQPLALPQRIGLKPNLHYGRQDTTSSDTRTSFDHSGKHRETCCRGDIEFLACPRA